MRMTIQLTLHELCELALTHPSITAEFNRGADLVYSEGRDLYSFVSDTDADHYDSGIEVYDAAATEELRTTEVAQ